MDELKQAYATLGLPETASKDELDHRYYLLLRRARAQKMRKSSEADSVERVDEDAVSQAYRFIKDEEEQRAKAAFTAEKYGTNEKKAARAQKRAHFLHYYKFHILGAIILLVAIGFGINSYIDRQHEKAELAKLPPADLSIMFFGNYFYGEGINSDTKPLDDAILKAMPEWRRVITGLTYVPDDTKSEQDIAMLQKSMLVLITDKSDLFILDKANFDKLATNNGLLPLESLSADLPSVLQVKSRAKDDTADHVYGIDLSGTAMAKELGIQGNSSLIAGIRTFSTKQDQAMTFIRHYAAK